MADTDSKTGSKTIPEFCTDHKFSESFYHKLDRLKPREMRIRKCVRISREAELEWIKAREADGAAESPEAA